MKNAALIIGGIALIAIIVAIIFFATAKKTSPINNDSSGGANNNTGGNNTGGGGGATNTGGSNTSGNNVSNSEIERRADELNEWVNAWWWWDNCVLFANINALNDAQLGYFNTYYKNKYGITPNAEMDKSNFWCAENDNDDYPLYERFKAINAATGTTNTQGGNAPLSDTLKSIGDRFYGKFNGYGERCGIIVETNRLSDVELKSVEAYHKTKYSKTMKQMMDGCYKWCPTNTIDNTLYARLSY